MWTATSPSSSTRTLPTLSLAGSTRRSWVMACSPPPRGWTACLVTAGTDKCGPSCRPRSASRASQAFAPPPTTRLGAAAAASARLVSGHVGAQQVTGCGLMLGFGAVRCQLAAGHHPEWQSIAPLAAGDLRPQYKLQGTLWGLRPHHRHLRPRYHLSGCLHHRRRQSRALQCGHVQGAARSLCEWSYQRGIARESCALGVA